MNRCLIKDFEKRPSVTHLLDHPFIKGVHGKLLFLQKQLAKVLQDQKHLNPVVKTRYGSWHFSASSLWLFIKIWRVMCFDLPSIITGNYHISAFLSSIYMTLSTPCSVDDNSKASETSCPFVLLRLICLRVAEISLCPSVLV